MRSQIARHYLALLLTVFLLELSAQEIYPLQLSKEEWHGKSRELRYRPEGTDFVITNGNRLFTRSLYGTNTAFRIETGDRPEFALYMPGMGGNFKLGIQSGDSSKWLTNASKITARYRAGARIYTVEDPLLGSGKLQLYILALADAEGFVLKASFENVNQPVKFYWAFGGATGKKFSRDGDMGPDPESNFYLKPENCKDNRFTIDKGSFQLKYGSGLEIGQDGRYFVEDLQQQSKVSKEQTLMGIFPASSVAKIGDATKLKTPIDLFQSIKEKAPAIIGQCDATNKTDYYFLIYNPTSTTTYSNVDAADVFLQAEKSRQQIANRITIHTPDSFINTIGGTLAIASDAIWEAPSYMHGAIGWRMRLNGWRGPYTADVLGWHDRARTHLNAYAQSQVLKPEKGPVVADTATNLSRSLEKMGVGMFTSGYISRDPEGKNLRPHHYDMNLVYIDFLLRHYDWTGDIEFIKKTWPVLKRHLEWETRNFDADGDGLYDSYAAIWASDALQYSGGGVAHASAYNYYAFSKAAQIAKLMGEDAQPYQKQADKILQAMYQLLWIPEKGTFAEFKDALGNRLLHPSAALWTIYHSIDSKTMNPFQAWQSLRFIDNEIPHIPIRAKGLEDQGYYTNATTNWMPYEWSLNNVATAEVMHTALAYWQGGRFEEAFKLFKSQIISDMYLGGSPGNVGQISYYDATRGEAYRDFGDPVGMFSRALVEGLFGIAPDVLNKRLFLKPGLPSAWNYASFATPDIKFDFKRTGHKDHYTIIPNFPQSLDLNFQLIAQSQIKSIKVNGSIVRWKNVDGVVGQPLIEISFPASNQYKIEVIWEAIQPIQPSAELTVSQGDLLLQNIASAKVLKIEDPQHVLKNGQITASGFSGIVQAGMGHYSLFVQLKQGAFIWWMPYSLNIQKPLSLISANIKEENTHQFMLQNNTKKNEIVGVEVNGYNSSVNIPAGKISQEIIIPEDALVTGTNTVKLILQNGTILQEQLVNWDVNTKGNFETIDLGNYFNDHVTQIFKNKYLSPRPQVTTLQLPVQGIGDWPHFAATHPISDEGLRKNAGKTNTITLSQGIPFYTAADTSKHNILFTSQWDNYPKEIKVPLAGKASHAWFMMAGSTNPMQSQLTNGEVIVQYMDGTQDVLALRNPETWWPIDQDYYTDGFAFSLKLPRPIRIHLSTGKIINSNASKANYNGKKIPGGAATILDLPLNPSKNLKSFTLKTISNDVVIGLMSMTLLR